MKMILLAAAALIGAASPAAAGPAEDAAAAATIWLDKFNAGDLAAFHAGHAPNAVIVDEFAPYFWAGPNASQRWLEDFGKDAAANGITNPRVDYAAPIQASASGNAAYVVLPTIYRHQKGGKAMSAAGSMTFVMTKAGNDWKIASWTYSAPLAKPER